MEEEAESSRPKEPQQEPLVWWHRPKVWVVVFLGVAGAALLALSFWLPLPSPAQEIEQPSPAEADLLAANPDPPQESPSPSATTHASPLPNLPLPSTTPSPGRLIVVHILGAVLHPDAYTLAPDARVKDAVLAAGGLITDADDTSINLAARLQDEEQIWVAYLNQTSPPSFLRNANVTPLKTMDPTAKPNSQLSSGSNPASTTSLVNLNTANLTELGSLEGIGPALGQRIIDYREANGPFSTVSDLQKVKGIGSKVFEKIESRLTVGD